MQALLTISGVLGKDKVYDNISTAVVGCMQNVQDDATLFVDAGVCVLASDTSDSTNVVSKPPRSNIYTGRKLV